MKNKANIAFNKLWKVSGSDGPGPSSGNAPVAGNRRVENPMPVAARPRWPNITQSLQLASERNQESVTKLF